jgi:preprotein translocase subunit SecA
MTAAASVLAGSPYPERDEPREGKLERLLTALRYFTGSARTGRARLGLIVEATRAAGEAITSSSDDELRARAAALRSRLRLDGYADPALAGEAFALIRETASRVIGQRHFDVQLIGGWAMLNGMVSEMETGEGKTLTATLAAATAALSGRAVHVITVNDYLAGRDAEWMRPIYEALGLSVGCIEGGMDPASRRAAYRCDVTYCSNKEIAFDYLRDRMVLGGRPQAIALRLDALVGAGMRRRLLLRGLQFAIVDEADSVLVDEARTPLILSAEADHSQEEAIHRQALDLAQQLSDADYEVRDNGIEINGSGSRRLENLARNLTGVWRGPRRREQLLRQALSALHFFRRDKHYLVRDGKVVIIDEFTGRLMPDRSWEQGLHQLIEIKEGCDVTGRRETLARISYQRFFRRYVHLSGMTGTASEVAGELWAVYGLRVAKIPTHKPARRVRGADRVFGSSDAKWRTVVETIERQRLAGRPVLVGTRSVEASEHLAALLDKAQLPYRLLNARQDRDEAEIVAKAGEAGCVTVATNMAGRGTDIKLGAGVAEKGGLHVIATELHDSGRIDRQLFGRCGRQGDPGTCEAILAIEDDLVESYLPLAAARLRDRDRVPERLGMLAFRLAQWRAESAHSRARRDLLDLDDYLGDVLAFAGRGE